MWRNASSSSECGANTSAGVIRDRRILGQHYSKGARRRSFWRPNEARRIRLSDLPGELMASISLFGRRNASTNYANLAMIDRLGVARSENCRQLGVRRVPKTSTTFRAPRALRFTANMAHFVPVSLL